VKLFLTFDNEFLGFKPADYTRLHQSRPNSNNLAVSLDTDDSFTAQPFPRTPPPGEGDCDEDGSISDNSGASDTEPLDTNMEPPTPLLPPERVPSQVHTKIPAMKKRNKVNLLKLVQTICDYGPYNLLVELGPKGEARVPFSHSN
jgi:hypothetical protein